MNFKSAKFWSVIEIIAAAGEFAAFIIFFLAESELLGVKSYATKALVKAYCGMGILVFFGIVMLSLVILFTMGKTTGSKKCVDSCHC